MIIEPKVRGFICTTAHPTGCAESVRAQAEYALSHRAYAGKKALIIGCSTGYGLSSRIAAAFGSDTATLGVMFEREAVEPRTATAGWYNTAAFEALAHEKGLYAATINGDAYSKEVKDKTIAKIKQDLGSVDLVVYSLAAPRRVMPDGTTASSVLKTVGEPYTNKSIDLRNNTVTEVTVPVASEKEIEDTVKVMGGSDWIDWINALKDAGVLAENAVTVAYSYIGPKLTHPMYYNGTIGAAKRDLIASAKKLSSGGVKAYVSTNKALVTQSSAAIPVVPLYISILYKIMKKKGLHEGCIEQMCRMFKDKKLMTEAVTDSEGLIRLDDYELNAEVQAEVEKAWTKINADNLNEYADIEGYWDDFYKMFGFKQNIDYTKDVDAKVAIESIEKDKI